MRQQRGQVAVACLAQPAPAGTRAAPRVSARAAATVPQGGAAGPARSDEEGSEEGTFWAGVRALGSRGSGARTARAPMAAAPAGMAVEFWRRSTKGRIRGCAGYAGRVRWESFPWPIPPEVLSRNGCRSCRDYIEDCLF